MSDQFTPTLDEARAIYALGTPAHHVSIGGSYAEFDRAIAKVRTDAKVEALREAAFELKTNPVKGDDLFTRLILPSCNTFAVFQLLARADNLEKR